MVKRKEVKIDEEQIRRVMAGDIPASVLENRYGSNAADSQKKMTRNRKRKTGPGFLPNPTRWKFPVPVCPAVKKKRRPRSSGRKHAGKEQSSGVSRTSVRQQRCERASADLCQQRELRTVRTLLSVIAPTLSISCYIDNILSAHLEQYRDELNAIYSSRINLKPL